MDRESALRLLGVDPSAQAAQIERVYGERVAELDRRIADAPTEALKETYRKQRAEVDRARQALLSTPAAPGLSLTQMNDLPGARPMYTSDGGDSGGARVAVAEGQVLAGRYEVRRRLGAGGMGAVYVAFDRNREQEIAIKVMLPGLLEKEGALNRFMGEAKVSIDLAHGNIVKVLDVNRDGPLHFITMELLDGSTLRDAMNREKKFPIAEAVRIATALCDALAYAHTRTVHRDIKPENVFLCKDGTVKLMDFGIARLLSASQLTVTGMSMGTAYYMAPEQLKGAKDVDGRADQYSLAVVLYEMLVGEVPAGRVKPAREKRRDTPRTLSDALDRALEADPADRYPDMKAFAQAISRPGVSLPPGMLKLAAVAAVLVALGATFPIWRGPVGAWLKGIARSQDAKAKAEKAREEAARELDAWERWVKSNPVREPGEVAKARDAMARGTKALAAQDDDDASAAFEDARESLRTAMDRGKAVISRLSEAKKLRDDAVEARKEWEKVSAGAELSEPDEVRQAHAAMESAEKFFLDEQGDAAGPLYVKARDGYVAGAQKRQTSLGDDAHLRREDLRALAGQLSRAGESLAKRAQAARTALQAAKKAVEDNQKKQDDSESALQRLRRDEEDIERSIAAKEGDLRASTDSRDQKRLRDDIERYRAKLKEKREDIAKAQSDAARLKEDRVRLDKDQAAAERTDHLFEKFRSECQAEIHEGPELRTIRQLESLGDQKKSERHYPEAMKLYAEAKMGYELLLARHDTDAWMRREPAREAALDAQQKWERVAIAGWKHPIPARDQAVEKMKKADDAALVGKYEDSRAALAEAESLYRTLTREWTAFVAARSEALREKDELDKFVGEDLRRKIPAIDTTMAAAEGHETAARFDPGRVAWDEAAATLRKIRAEAKSGQARDAGGRTPLHRAAAAGDTAAIERLLTVGAAIDGKDAAGSAPLHLAAAGGHLEACRTLVARGASVSAAGQDGRTPLHFAAAAGARDVAAFLLDSKAAADARCAREATALHYAAASKPDVIVLLLERGAEVEAADRDGTRPLHAAAFTGRVELVEALLSKNATLDAKDAKSRTPLVLAAAADHGAVVTRLVKAGASADMRGSSDRTALHEAAAVGAADAVDALLAAGARAELQDANGATALALACDASREKAALVLARHGGSPNVKDRRARTSLHAAVERNLRGLLPVLIEKGADPAIADDDGATPLHIAAGAGLTEAGRVLLDANAPVNAKDRAGRTPLFLAVEAAASGRNSDNVRALLMKSADVNAGDASGVTPLQIASRAGLLAVAKLLVERDADVKAGNPLYLAAERGHASVVRLLLGRSADANVATADGLTPLHAAAAGGHADAVRALVEQRAAIDAKTKQKATPLLLAVSGGHTEVARILVDAKADVDAADTAGRSPAGAAARDPAKWGWLMRASRSNANVIRLYRGGAAAELEGNLRWVNGVAFHPSNGSVVCAAADQAGVVKLWDAAKRAEVESRDVREQPRAAAFSSDGKSVAIATSDGVRLWKPADRRFDRCTSGFDTKWVAWHPNGKLLAFDDAEGIVHVVDESGRTQKKVARKGPVLTAGAFSADGKKLAVGQRDGEIVVYDTATWSPLRSLSGHREQIRSLSFGGERHLLSGGSNEDLMMWDAESGERIFGWAGKGGHAAFSPDGTAFAAGTRDGRITIWETGSRGVLKEYKTWDGLARRGGVYSLSFSADAKFLATGHDDGVVRIWGGE